MRRALTLFLIGYLAGVTALAVVAGIVSLVSDVPFMDGLFWGWFLGGIVVLCYAGIMGSGMVEATHYKSSLMSLSSVYAGTIAREYPERRRDHMATLVVGGLLGAAMLMLAALLYYMPLLVIPTLVVLYGVLIYIYVRRGVKVVPSGQ